MERVVMMMMLMMMLLLMGMHREWLPMVKGWLGLVC